MAEGGGGNLLPERDGGSQQSSPASSTTSLSSSVKDLRGDRLETSDSPVCTNQRRPASLGVLSEPPDQLALARGAAHASPARTAAPPRDAGLEEAWRLAPTTAENSPPSDSERVSASSSEPDPVCTAQQGAVNTSDAFDETGGQPTARTGRDLSLRATRQGAARCCSVARAASDPLAYARRGPSLSQRGNPAAPASPTPVDTSSCHLEAPPALGAASDAASGAEADGSNSEVFESEASSASEASPPEFASPPNAASAPAPPSLPQEANAGDGGVEEPHEAAVVAEAAAAASAKPAANPAIVLALPASAVGNADEADPQGAVAQEPSALQLLSPIKPGATQQASGGGSDSRQRPKPISPAAADALAAAAGANTQLKIRVNQAHQQLPRNLTSLPPDQTERRELSPSCPEVDDRPPINEQNRAISTLTIIEQEAIMRERGNGGDGDAVSISAGRSGSRQTMRIVPTAAVNEGGNGGGVSGVGGGGGEASRRRFNFLRRLLRSCIGEN